MTREFCSETPRKSRKLLQLLFKCTKPKGLSKASFVILNEMKDLQEVAIGGRFFVLPRKTTIRKWTFDSPSYIHKCIKLYNIVVILLFKSKKIYLYPVNFFSKGHTVILSRLYPSQF